MVDLFKKRESEAATQAERMPANVPLAARMRPASLDEVLGQDHILGQGRLLRRVIEADRLTNMIFYGPPGCGKTSLAEVIARVTKRRFERSSGVLSNVATLREICEKARIFRDEHTVVLFIDEIHRFNKAQQDVLLPYVEDGTVLLIGATTHNPQVFINSPLTSRSLVFELNPLSRQAVRALLESALRDKDRGLGLYKCDVSPEALDFLSEICDGDARRALTALEVAVRSTPAGHNGIITIDTEVMSDCVQRKMIRYDRDEDGHYDTISAFIKSMRGSDPDAAIYWLAKMLEAGEDPRFIARRLAIFASEDVGNADPRCLTVAVAAMQAAEFVGMPEARIILAQATTYLATAPKSNASYVAIDEAMNDVRQGRTLAVPEHLKNLRVKAEGKEEGESYKYPHDFSDKHVDQEYFSSDNIYYRPDGMGYEDVIKKRLESWRSRRAKRE